MEIIFHIKHNLLYTTAAVMMHQKWPVMIDMFTLNHSIWNNFPVYFCPHLLRSEALGNQDTLDEE